MDAKSCSEKHIITQNVVRDRIGGATFVAIILSLMICAFFVVAIIGCVNQKKLQEERFAVRPEIVYENRWDNIKPLSTANFAVDIETSQVEGEKYAVYRFVDDKDGARYRYVLQENENGTINTVRVEKLDPPRNSSGRMVVVPIFFPH